MIDKGTQAASPDQVIAEASKELVAVCASIGVPSLERALSEVKAAGGSTSETSAVVTEADARTMKAERLSRAAHALRRAIAVAEHGLGLELAVADARLSTFEAAMTSADDTFETRFARIDGTMRLLAAEARDGALRFGDRFARALPAEIDRAEADQLRTYLSAFVEDRFRTFAEEESEKLVARMHAVADEALAFLAEDAEARAKFSRETLGPNAPRVDVRIDTFGYDVGVFALGAFGIGMMVMSSFLLGGALAIAAPVLAVVLRERADRELKVRLRVEAPIVVRRAGERMGESAAARVEAFRAELEAFLRESSEDLTHAVRDGLRAARDAIVAGEAGRSALRERITVAYRALSSIEAKLAPLRASSRA